MKDFFISYNSADTPWAEWVAWQLEAIGYSVKFQNWDMRPGANLVIELDKALREAKQTIAILSPNYLDVNDTYPEWAVAFQQDPKGERRSLIPVKVRPCELTGLLGPIVYIDLVGIEDEVVALNRLLDGIKQRREDIKPKKSPVFPPKSPKERFPGSLPPTWNVTEPRNPFFTGREGILKQLYKTLNEGNVKQPQVISGLGGIGKTQTALEYAYRYRDKYDAVFWVRGGANEKIVADFVEIAQILSLPEKDVKERIQVVNAVKRWLERETSWLLIIDDVEDIKILDDLLPHIYQGHILLTMRNEVIAVTNSMPLNKMELEEAKLFLLRRTKKINIPDGTLKNVNVTDLLNAQQICELVDNLPLALDQAGAYIQETGCSLKAYLELYKEQRPKLLTIRGVHPFGHPDSVATTWSLSSQHINAPSLELLMLCAFLYPDEIPEDIITVGAPDLGPILWAIGRDALRLNNTLKELIALSLIRRDTEARTISIHRLVQVVIIDGMDSLMQKQWAERAVCAVNRVFPEVKFEHWDQCQQYLPHVQECAKHIEKWDMKFSEAGRLLHLAGYYLQERAQYDQAWILCNQASLIRKTILISGQLNMAESLNDLALLYRTQGKYAQAEPLCQKAIEIRRAVLEERYPSANADWASIGSFIDNEEDGKEVRSLCLSVATSQENLALLYLDQAKYEKAEALLKETQRIRDVFLAANDLAIAQCLNNLALLNRTQGKYSEAEQYHKGALEIRYRNHSGEEHPDIAESLNDLADLYRMQGKYSEAEPNYQRALEIRRKVLGKGHPHPEVAQSINSLALLYVDLGKYAEAENYYKQALRMREQILGQENPDTAQSLNDLALLYRIRGKYIESEELYKRSLTVREQILGKEHPDVAQSLSNLALLYIEQGKYDQAEKLCLQALEIRQRFFGQNQLHPDIARSLSDLALLYYVLGKYALAESYYKRVLESYEQIFGKDHPYVAATLNSLALLYKDQGIYVQGEKYYERALEIRRSVFGEDHPLVAQSLNNLGALYYAMGNFDPVDPLLEKALRIQELILGPDHLDVAQTLSNLAKHFRGRQQYDKAEQIYKRALVIRRKALGEEHPEVAQGLNALARLYRAKHLYADAEELCKEALSIDKKAFGENHPYVATCLNNLAELYRVQKLYSQAEDLYRRALVIRREILGSNHPDVAQILNNLAELYRDQGNYDSASKNYLQALHIREQVLGGEHPHVAQSLLGLARVYKDQGSYVQAEQNYKKAFHIRTALGYEDQHVKEILQELRSLYLKQKKRKDANEIFEIISVIELLEKQKDDEKSEMLASPEENYQRALILKEAGEKIFGSANLQVVRILRTLADYYYKQKNYESAEVYYHRIYATLNHNSSVDDPEIIRIINKVGELYVIQRKYAAAELLYQQELEAKEKALGEKHPNVVALCDELANVYFIQRKYALAEELYKRVLKVRERALELGHPAIAMTLRNLARLYSDKGEYTKAEAYYYRVLLIQERSLGGKHPDIVRCLIDLAEVYIHTNKTSEAESLYEEAVSICEQTAKNDIDLVNSVESSYVGYLLLVNQMEKAEEVEERLQRVVTKDQINIKEKTELN